MSAPSIRIHPLAVRITHWVNAFAILLMVLSGWRIYNASPLFDFTFADPWTLGGWLAGALQWHFAAMWLLFANGAAYLAYAVLSGHLRRKLLPFSPRAALRDALDAVRLRLAHDDLSVYNAAQRAAYLGVLVLVTLAVLSGLVLWKPVQLQALGMLMGDYEGARYVHFACMAGIVLFVVVHVAMAALVPRTLPAMITGNVRVRRTS
jgi:thiosulfate reductase cytochrome b subunit